MRQTHVGFTQANNTPAPVETPKPAPAVSNAGRPSFAENLDQATKGIKGQASAGTRGLQASVANQQAQEALQKAMIENQIRVVSKVANDMAKTPPPKLKLD